jgi:predicted glycosyltransferase
MAGYNSVCEVLATDRPALLVPRTHPRTEQLVRAQRLAELGAADMLPMQGLSSDRLRAWTAAAVRERTTAARAEVDLTGLCRLPAIAERLLADAPVGERRIAARGVTRRGVEHRAA